MRTDHGLEGVGMQGTADEILAGKEMNTLNVGSRLTAIGQQVPGVALPCSGQRQHEDPSPSSTIAIHHLPGSS